MASVQLADIRAAHSGPLKSPWQVKCCHDGITEKLGTASEVLFNSKTPHTEIPLGPGIDPALLKSH